MLKYSTYRSIYDETGKVNSAGGHSASLHMNKPQHSTAALLSALTGMLRREQLMKLVLVLMLVISGFTVVGNVFANSAPSVQQEKRIVVERGDTLWSIALENKPSTMRTVIYIEGIKQSSGLKDSNIKAGDVLVLPVY